MVRGLFRLAMKIRERLVLADANDAQAQRDLFIRVNRLLWASVGMTPCGRLAVSAGQLHPNQRQAATTLYNARLYARQPRQRAGAF